MASVRKREWNSPDGKTKSAWEVAYKDQDGKRRAKQFKMKKAADAFLLKVQTEIEAGIHVADGQTTTIAQLCKEYLTYSEGRVGDGRIGRMRHRSIDQGVRNSIVPNVGGLKIKDLTPVRVEKLYAEMTQKDGLSPVSAKYRLQMLRQMVDFGIKHGYVRTNPVREGLRALRGSAKPTIRTFAQEEVVRLLKVSGERRKGDFEHTNAAVNLMVNIAAFCGLRYGEIIGLTLSHVDLGKRLIRVRKSLSRLDGLKGPKTAAGNRDVPVPTHVVAMIRSYLDRYYLKNRDELIIRTVRNGDMLGTAFHKHHWPKLLGRAGLLDDGERFHFHALRHFTASWWIANGLPLTDVAALLGHAKFDMTLQVYAHAIVGGSARHDAIDRMSSLLIEAPIVIDAPLVIDTPAIHAAREQQGA